VTPRLATFVAPRSIALDVSPLIVGLQGGAFAVDLLAVIRE